MLTACVLRWVQVRLRTIRERLDATTLAAWRPPPGGIWIMTGPSHDGTVAGFFAACARGDLALLRSLLARDALLVEARDPDGMTGLHVAVRHPEAVRILLEHGADPSARDVGDNALPLHGAAGHGNLDSVRLLLEAGSDVQGIGDLHEMDTIGWATCFAEARRDVVELLVAHGARHHVFSAIATGDRELVRQVVVGDPAAMRRKLSRFEQEQSALHYVIAPADGIVGGLFRTGDHYETLAMLIELGADLEARDAKGRTPLMLAMLRGDERAMRMLHAAGAAVPSVDDLPGDVPGIGASIGSTSVMLSVPDVAATVAWYQAIGFELAGSHDDGERLDWASVTLGGAELMFTASGLPWQSEVRGVSLWFRTDRLDELYAMLKRRALEQARDLLAGDANGVPQVRITGDLYTAFYGQREFSIRDPNGVDVNFFQPLP
jgi:ankyrin repeat protein/catechol 2,3-dioxygenase-like lactoylglutathione lyase family enzyme